MKNTKKRNRRNLRLYSIRDGARWVWDMQGKIVTWTENAELAAVFSEWWHARKILQEIGVGQLERLKLIAFAIFAFALSAGAQSVNTKNPNGTITMRPARLAYVVRIETATNLAGPWISQGESWGPNGGAEPCAAFAFTTPAIRSGEPQRFWRLVIVR
jgi:hypothetical protein